MRIRHKISFTAFFILVIGIIAYITIPFSRLEQIHVFRQDGAPDDKIGIFIDRLLVYNHYLYVYKGVSFNDLRCYSNEGRKYTISIKFNFDNSISVSENDQEITLNIDSIDFETDLSYGIVSDFYDDEYYFESISFFDTKQMCCESLPSSIVLFRQNKALRCGPHRYGFTLDINNHHLSTGNEQNEHIFEDSTLINKYE